MFMTAVDSFSVENVLSGIYRHNFIYLVSAETKYPSAKGMFNVSGFNYSEHTLNHLTAIDTLFCWNQLTYVALVDWMEVGTAFSDMNFDHSTIDRFLSENVLLLSSSISFKKHVSLDEAIEDEITIENTKSKNGFYIAEISARIEDAVTGSFQGVIKKELD